MNLLWNTELSSDIFLLCTEWFLLSWFIYKYSPYTNWFLIFIFFLDYILKKNMKILCWKSSTKIYLTWILFYTLNWTQHTQSFFIYFFLLRKSFKFSIVTFFLIFPFNFHIPITVSKFVLEPPYAKRVGLYLVIR